MAALCGLDPWKTSHNVWESKHSETFLQPDSSINTPIWWGHQQEASIIKAATSMITHMERWDYTPWSRTGITVASHQFMASPDAILTSDFYQFGELPPAQHCLIEAKTVGEKSKTRWIKGPPKYVVLQAQAQMCLLGSEATYIAARIAGAPVRIWKAEADADVKEAIRTIVGWFWECIGGLPNDWDTKVRALLVEANFLAPVEEKKAKPIGLEEVAAILEWEEAKRIARKATADAEEARGKVDEIFGEHVGDVTFEGKILATRDAYKKSAFDRATFSCEHPELAEKYEVVTEYHIMRTKSNLKEMR